jgi:two-component system phosphate regulon response regulator PhoB
MGDLIKILVIEDDSSLCELLAELFNEEGYHYKICEDADQIFFWVEQFNPDVILLDYMLPSTNGGEVCMQLKCNEKTKQIPVIIYSAVNKELLPLDEYKCDSFVAKPFDINDLVRTIEKHTHRSHAA